MPRRAFNDDRLEVIATARALEAEIPATPTRSPGSRRRRASRCATSSARSKGERRHRGRVRGAAGAWFERLLGPERATSPTSYHVSYMRRLSPLEAIYTKEQAVAVCMDDAGAARLRPRGRAEHQARPRRPPAEVAARLRDPVRPAEGRAPDHPRAGRAARLPGVPARGRACAPLRRLRSGAAVHVPQHLARPRADGDLLVHRRGDLAPARVARASLRPLGRGGGARTPRRRRSWRRCSSGATTAKLQFELDFWGALPEDGGTPGGYEERLTEATGRPLPRRRLPRRHGRGFLLGRLPARLDPRRAAPLATSKARSAPEWWRSTRDRRAPARALRRGDEALERGDRRAASASTRWTRARCWPSSAPTGAVGGAGCAPRGDRQREQAQRALPRPRRRRGRRGCWSR